MVGYTVRGTSAANCYLSRLSNLLYAAVVIPKATQTGSCRNIKT